MKKILMLLPLLFAFAFFACQKKGPEARVDYMKDKLSSELKLNKDQETKLNDLANTVKDQMKAMKQKRAQEGNEELKALIMAPKMDAEKTKAYFEQKRSTMASSAESFYEAIYPKLAVFHDSLNDEQRQKAAAMVDKVHKHWNED